MSARRALPLCAIVLLWACAFAHAPPATARIAVVPIDPPEPRECRLGFHDFQTGVSVFDKPPEALSMG